MARQEEKLICVKRVHEQDIDSSNVKTTMIYTHVLNRGGRAVQSPMDLGLID